MRLPGAGLPRKFIRTLLHSSEMNDREIALLEQLNKLLDGHERYEEHLRAGGRAFVYAYGLVLPRESGAPWTRRLRLRSRLPAARAAELASLCERRIIQESPGYFGEESAASLTGKVPDSEDLVVCMYKLATGAIEPSWIAGYCLAERHSTSGFLPAGLRALVVRGRFVVRQARIHMSTPELFAESSAAGLPRYALRKFLEFPGCHAAILWSFVSLRRTLISVASVGVAGQSQSFSVPLATQGQQVRYGILSMLRPEIPIIVYDAQDRGVWRPEPMRPDWGPRDRKTFQSNNWRSCAAIPITAEGYMVGGLSLYSRGSAEQLVQMLTAPEIEHLRASIQGYLRSIEEEQKLAVIERQFADELSTATGTLAVIGHVHDLANFARTTQESLKLAENFLESGDRDLARGKLREAIEASSTLNALADEMRRIARDRVRGPTVIEVSEVVEQMSNVLRMQVRDQGGPRARLSIANPRVPGLTTSVFADKLKLERILLNLVDNGAYWARTGSSTPEVSLRVVPVAEAMGAAGVMIEIEDNGPGIAREIRPDIWTRWFTTRAGEGTGLGLWLVRVFVAEMDGEVDVTTTRPGKTIFTITIPIAGQVKGSKS